MSFMTDNIEKEPLIEASWKSQLLEEFKKPYMLRLKQFLKEEKAKNKLIFPKGKNIFKAFELTPFDKVRVVILGQDPYHGPGQAQGLAFSVPPGLKIPPSLINIFKELKSDLNIDPARHGCLESWAKQGVLLLNSVLTVECHQAASHQGQGWEQLTDSVIEILNKKSNPIVFVLWGSYAQRKGAIIDEQKHLVIKSVHPSPLAAHRGFFGSKPFSKINLFLDSKGYTPIQWQLPEMC